MSKLIDNHAHLQDKRLIPNEQAIKNLIAKIEQKMGFVVVSGANHEWNKQAVDIFINRYPSNKIFVTLGIHPVDSIKLSEKEFEQALEYIKEQAKKHKNKIIGIGEIGMDYHWVKESDKHKLMEQRFIQQIELADELNLPIILHTWDAELDAINIAHKNKNDNKVVLHCYSSHKHHELIHEYGFYASVCTNITRNKSVKKHAKRLNIENMLTETDAPYLAPVQGELNYPWNVEIALKKIAELKNLSFEEVRDQIYENFVRFYGLEDSLKAE